MLNPPGSVKAAHPLADPQDAQRLLDALPAHDPLRALDELTRWQESVSSAPGLSLGRKIDLLLAIEAVARPRVSQLAGEYLAAMRPTPAVENHLWNAIHGYWKQAGEGCVRVLEDALPGAGEAWAVDERLPALLVCALSCLAQQIKWMHFRYGPIDAAVWGTFNRVYALAESRRLADAKVACSAGQGESTPRREFLRGAMLGAVSPNSLLPQAIELAERLIDGHVARFVLAHSPAADLPYWTDLGQAMAPQRLARTPGAAPGLRYFGAGAALEDLTLLARKLDTTGQISLVHAGLGVGADAQTLLDVLRHLAAHWSPRAPQRRHTRHVVRSRLSVAHGFDGVVGALLSGSVPDLDGQGMESWVVEDVSAGGFGALVPPINGDWLRVGTLLAMRPEGSESPVVGVVRRVNRTADQQARVGIQTLSKSPVVAEFSLDRSTERGVLLRSGVRRSDEALIALRPGVFASGQELRAERDGRRFLFLPQGISERGADYEIAHFRERVVDS
ncbi:MAG TPA: hypothetical protein VNF69_14010 [Burkholderiales bacterium]|nr:hypothetical protein [Burkholderiales bacterium]